MYAHIHPSSAQFTLQLAPSSVAAVERASPVFLEPIMALEVVTPEAYLGAVTGDLNARRAEITDFHPHDLRHTCAAWLVTAGVPLPEVRDLLGHSTIQMTERYAHLAPENVRAAVNVLDDSASRFGHVDKRESNLRRSK